jgi:hypothetical protein
MKIKLGTQMEEEVYRNLKVAAAHENRAIGELKEKTSVPHIHIF